MTALDVVELQAADKAQAAAVWAESFHQYSVMRYIFKDAATEAEYVTKLKTIMGYYFDNSIAHGWPVLGVRDGGRVVAALCAIGPNTPETPASFKELEKTLLEDIGAAAIERGEFYDQCTHAHEPKQPHYYVGVLGVANTQQGSGLAGQLLKAIHEVSRQDPASEGVCLFTETESNVGFYQYMGYEVLANFHVVEGVQSWAFFRADVE